MSEFQLCISPFINLQTYVSLLTDLYYTVLTHAACLLVGAVPNAYPPAVRHRMVGNDLSELVDLSPSNYRSRMGHEVLAHVSLYKLTSHHS